MRIGILQPGYLPWLGFFEQIYRTDIFVLYDSVLYDKGGWRNRNRIKTANGVQWLTVPVHFKSKNNPLILDIKIDNSTNWKKKHLNCIRYYHNARYYQDYIKIFEAAFSMDWEYLVEIDIYFIHRFLEILGMTDKKIIRSSTIDLKSEDKNKRNIEICMLFNADVFYEGSAGRDYIDTEMFNRYNIIVEYQDYKHPVYNQLFGDFVPYLSIVDLIFNHGPESLDILTTNAVTKKQK